MKKEQSMRLVNLDNLLLELLKIVLHLGLLPAVLHTNRHDLFLILPLQLLLNILQNLLMPRMHQLPLIPPTHITLLQQPDPVLVPLLNRCQSPCRLLVLLQQLLLVLLTLVHLFLPLQLY